MIEAVSESLWAFRGDLLKVHGVLGGKALACSAILERHLDPVGIITAGAKSSPQVNIVAHIAKAKGLPCRVHVPSGALKNPEIQEAQACGAEVVEHFPGYNSVIIARAEADAQDRPGWALVPFGMDHLAAVHSTAALVPESFPEGVRRIVIPVGSGMSAIGLLYGLARKGIRIPVLGIQVGANPRARFVKYGFYLLGRSLEILRSPNDYEYSVLGSLGDIPLDPHYEAKCLPYLKSGDLLWIVGRRNSR